MVFWADDRCDPKDDVLLLCNVCLSSKVEGKTLAGAILKARRLGWRLAFFRNWDLCQSCVSRHQDRQTRLPMLGWLRVH